MLCACRVFFVYHIDSCRKEALVSGAAHLAGDYSKGRSDVDSSSFEALVACGVCCTLHHFYVVFGFRVMSLEKEGNLEHREKSDEQQSLVTNCF